MNDAQPIGIRHARKRTHGIESLPATERDVLVAVAGVNQRDDPRTGAELDAIVAEMETWYDRRSIMGRSVGMVCGELADRGLVVEVEPGRFRETIDALDGIDVYLRHVRERWTDVHPDESGRKTVIESRQVAPDHGGAIEDATGGEGR